MKEFLEQQNELWELLRIESLKRAEKYMSDYDNSRTLALIEIIFDQQLMSKTTLILEIKYELEKLSCWETIPPKDIAKLEKIAKGFNKYEKNQ